MIGYGSLRSRALHEFEVRLKKGYVLDLVVDKVNTR